jgi:hypothetical protein
MSIEARSIDERENEKRRINEEIRNYPTPIAGCDAQFNFLLEEQARIVKELDQLRGSELK